MRRGIWTDMTRVAFALPELYPDSHFPRHARTKELQNTLNWNAYECPKCHYQSPLESWGFWSQRKKPTSQQWKVLKEKTQGPQLVF